MPPPEPPPPMDGNSGPPTDTIPLHALVSPVPTSASQSHDVVVKLDTFITISDFNRFYHTDTASFEPVYHALSDGSLVAPPFLSDTRATNVALVVHTFLLTVFARNICTSAAFILCGKVRKKSLLYTLFVSQLLATPAIIPLLIAQFQRAISCKVIMLVVVTSGRISQCLLITGILGVKAYRCLDNSRFVLVVLLTLSTAALVSLASDLASQQSRRSLSGLCYQVPGHFSSAFIILLLVESLFVCLCFLYAVWKSYGSVAARGRIAISLSLDDIPEPPLESRTQSMETSHSRRGWWEYVSTADPSSSSSRSCRTESISSYHPSVLTGNGDGVRRLDSGERVFHRNTIPSVSPIPPPPLDCNSSPRMSTVRMSVQTFPSPLREGTLPIPRRPSSLAPSSMSRVSRYMPRMTLFKRVMRDELIYTTFITAFTFISVVLTLVGFQNESESDQLCWIGLDWALISCLVMHSFGRVIRRHENEVLLQQPSACRHNLFTDQNSAGLLGEERTRATRSSLGRISQTRTRGSALTTRRHDVAHSLFDPSTRQLSSSSSSYVADTLSASSVRTSNPLCPVQEVTKTHVILSSDHPGHDSPSSHKNDSPKSTRKNSLPHIDLPGDQRSLRSGYINIVT